MHLLTIIDIADFKSIYSDVIHYAILSNALSIAKLVCVILVMAQYSKLFFKAYKMGEDGAFSYYDLYKPIVMVILIISYSTIIDQIEDISFKVQSEFVDNINGSVINSTNQTQADPSLSDSPPPSKPPKPDVLTAGALSIIKFYLLRPELILMNIIKYLIDLICGGLWTIILIMRYLVLFLLRFIGVFAIALSVYDRFSSYVWNWLRAYGVYLLWIALILLVNLFLEAVRHVIYNKFGGFSDTSLVGGVLLKPRDVSMYILLLLLNISKILAYFQSKELLKQIFSNAE